MNRFGVCKSQLKRLLISLVCSIVVSICGFYFLVFSDDDFKISGWFLIIASVSFLISTVFSYINMTIEVIVNEDNICINKPGFNEVKSQTVNFSDIISVSCAQKMIPITRQVVTTVSIVTKTGTILINNIENENELIKIINEKINHESNHGKQ